MDTSEAERLGMVNRMVPLSRLEQEVDGWASRLMDVEPTLLRTCKQFMVETQRLAPPEASAYGIQVLASAFFPLTPPAQLRPGRGEITAAMP